MGTQRVIQGTVVSDKMQKTVVVSVERKKKHQGPRRRR
jgi:ribosomal protein S17